MEVMRWDVINHLLSRFDDPSYLEIGTRNGENFNRINCKDKIGVDPNTEADKKMTSDQFFKKNKKKFDVIFIDGDHHAEQVQRDINNSLKVLRKEGFVVLHDCNPPTIYHARERYEDQTPAGRQWCGTAWKAFYRARVLSSIYSCCIDTDFGVGILSNDADIGYLTGANNSFFEYDIMAANRKEHLGLVSFEEFKSLID